MRSPFFETWAAPASLDHLIGAGEEQQLTRCAAFLVTECPRLIESPQPYHWLLRRRSEGRNPSVSAKLE